MNWDSSGEPEQKRADGADRRRTVEDHRAVSRRRAARTQTVTTLTRHRAPSATNAQWGGPDPPGARWRWTGSWPRVRTRPRTVISDLPAVAPRIESTWVSPLGRPTRPNAATPTTPRPRQARHTPARTVGSGGGQEQHRPDLGEAGQRERGAPSASATVAPGPAPPREGDREQVEAGVEERIEERDAEEVGDAAATPAPGQQRGDREVQQELGPQWR